MAHRKHWKKDAVTLMAVDKPSPDMLGLHQSNQSYRSRSAAANTARLRVLRTFGTILIVPIREQNLHKGIIVTKSSTVAFALLGAVSSIDPKLALSNVLNVSSAEALAPSTYNGDERQHVAMPSAVCGITIVWLPHCVMPVPLRTNARSAQILAFQRQAGDGIGQPKGQNIFLLGGLPETRGT